MNSITLETGQVVFDPRGEVGAEPKEMSARLGDLKGIRLGVLDNSKWNASKLLRKAVSILQEEYAIGEAQHYVKESFSKEADAGLLKRIAKENDAVLTAIGD